MSSDVVLSSALRNNLLSLQNTQNLIDETQFKLATGRKVNSALDNPQSFFTAQSLSNRASDLSRLLDGIGQSIRTIEEADNGVTALTDLLDQANSIADQARAESNAVSNTASVTSNLTGLDVDSELTGEDANIDDGDTFTIQVGTQAAETFTIEGDTTARSLVATINDRAADDGANFRAAIVNGQIQLSSTDGNRLILSDTAGGSTLAALGFVGNAATDTNASRTVTAGSTLSISVSGTGTITGNTTLDSLNEFNLADAGTTSDVLQLEVGGDGGTFTLLDGANNDSTTTIDDFIDVFNSDTTGELAGLTASFDSSTNSIVITADSTVENFTISSTSAGNDIEITDAGQGQTITTGQSLTFAPGGGTGDNNTITNLQSDFDEIRAQIDTIVADANYRGTNLLGGDNLVTQFNEDNTSTLTTTGVDFTADGLGINAADFSSSTGIQQSIDETRAAIESVRQFGNTIANSLSIIQTRQSFTQDTINTLQSGADDLTVADQNAEGARLLALQTRQQLGVTSLSLAAQSQQSVLRLF